MLISEHSLYMDVHFFFRMIVRRLERRRKTMGMEDFFASCQQVKVMRRYYLEWGHLCTIFMM